MDSENKSSTPKPVPVARPPAKSKSAPRQQAGNSNSDAAPRPPRRNENSESRRENKESRRENKEPRRENNEQRRERPPRPERPKRQPAAASANAERAKPSADEKSHGPVVHVKGDLATGSVWAKGSKGPSFADIARHNPNAAGSRGPAKATPPPSKQSPTPSAEPKQSPPVPQEQHETAQPEPSQPQQPPQAPPAPQAAAPPPPPPQPQPEPAAAAQPEESSEEEEVMVMNAVQAAPVVVVEEVIAEVPAPAQTFIPPHYVLEIERVAAVKLPARVTQTAMAQRGSYMFSAQAGKPPTPPPTVQPHAVYRPDTANLGARQWSLGTDSRIQQPPQQQTWPASGQIDYWNNTADRAPITRPFMGAQAQAPYNTYQTSVPLSHQRPASNTFPMRFRSSDVSDPVLRQQPAAPFNRPSQATNGGGVW